MIIGSPIITFLSSGGGGEITVDSSLSLSSENPVQNKIITAELNGKVPGTRTVNSHTLSDNITLDAGDLEYDSTETYNSGTVGAELTAQSRQLSDNDLHLEEIPDTTQAITFDQSGNVQSIVHSKNNTAVRTDVFTFGENTITEVRTLANGHSLTMVTNLTTLETTVTYSEGGNG